MVALEVDSIYKRSITILITRQRRIIPALIIWGLVMVKAGFFVFLKRASVARCQELSLKGLATTKNGGR